MEGINTITEKLQQFTRKYYANELIRGVILFFSLGFLYLLCTLFLEYFLWLKPTARTFLFWLFILVQIFLLFRFIIIPVGKLFGLQNGINDKEASKIIGKHFPEVKDKLLNILQLKEHRQQSDLLLASIQQKVLELQPIPFLKAVDFSKNIKYIKYAILPIAIFLAILLSGNNQVLKESLNRVVNYRTAYIPPAAFNYILKNKKTQVIQGEDFTVNLSIRGAVLPSDVKIKFKDQEYFITNNGLGNFSYTFMDVQKSVAFYFDANEIQSKVYELVVISTPTINNINLNLKYPRYTGKRNETISNPGNLVVPEGTKVTWIVDTRETEEVAIISNAKRSLFTNTSKNSFEFSKRINTSFRYEICSSNKSLPDYERLQFNINVIKDESPEITVVSNMEAISLGLAQFSGQISDDYGLTKLQLVYYNKKNPSELKVKNISISKENIQTFFYQFPTGLSLEKGVNYELYFEVYDNDMINGLKKSKSVVFNYRVKTNKEIQQEKLEEQRKSIDGLERMLLKQKKSKQGLKKLQEGFQKSKRLNWSDKKKVEGFIKKQNLYKKMMQRQTQKLQETLNENKEQDKTLEEKKEELQQRINELKKTDKQQKLLAEIAKIAEKFKKEELVSKIKELAQQNKQQERSLERTLELVKRFYVEQKTMQIANKLTELSEKQKLLELKDIEGLAEQKKIKEVFEDIKKELDELEKDNESLKEPMDLPDVDDEISEMDKDLLQTEEMLESSKKNAAKKSQKKVASKMKQMSGKMQKAMLDMEGESIEENMEDLRKILENLILFSYKQEGLMNKFDVISVAHPDFGKELKSQNSIRSYFEHIDDSLYILSMRLPKISGKIQNDLSSTHYNLEQSLENFSEGRFDNGISNQRYVMTATNNLADYLSTMLNEMKSASMKKGKGKSGKGKGFSLPDIIKKQGELSDKMKKGMKKGAKPGSKPGNKPGNKSGSATGGSKGKNKGQGKKGKNAGAKEKGGGQQGNDDLDGELYEIYKQQSQLRQQLESAIKENEGSGGKANRQAKKVLKSMEQLENEILEKGFNGNTVQKMQQLNYDLLKLDKATLEQGKDNKRKSITNREVTQRNNKKSLEFKRQFYNQIEILNRQSLPLQQKYKLKVRKYFSDPKKIKND